MNWTKANLKAQFDRAVAEGWLPVFKKYAELHGWPVEIVLAVASRETNMRNIKGDFRGGVFHGFGLMQVDRGTDAEFAKGGWEDPERSIKRGVEILSEKRDSLVKNAGKTLTIRDSRGNRVSLAVPKVPDSDLLKVVIAMYNGGWWPVYHYSKGRSPDHTTTGKDYSKDVLARAEVFKSFL
jgi:hypothetical protein